jgi:type IV fimbrial biogenesis protein FimT
MSYQNKNGRAGFTLIELMVTVSIVLILAASATPSFYQFIQTNQISSVQSEFIAVLALARNEAVKRNLPVLVQATSPQTGNEWGGGWQMGVDTDGNGVLGTGEPILKTHIALPAAISFGGSSVSSVYFSARGYLVTPITLQFLLCQVGKTTGASRIIIQSNGMSDVVENVNCS